MHADMEASDSLDDEACTFGIAEPFELDEEAEKQLEAALKKSQSKFKKLASETEDGEEVVLGEDLVVLAK